MKEKISQIIHQALQELDWVNDPDGDSNKEATLIELSVPEVPTFGHYSTSVALRLAKAHGKKPLDMAQELAAAIIKRAPAGFFEKVEAVPPGFVNFWLRPETIQKEFASIAKEEDFGKNRSLAGKLVMVEFTDANPFKLFHIGHLMSNAIGESFSRLHEAAGATVRRANYYGDVGLHIAKSIWGMERMTAETPGEKEALEKKMEFLGRAYALGSKSFEESEAIKEEIVAINKKIYAREDERINALYDQGLAWSMAYFETVYKRLGTKFNDYFPESAVAGIGVKLVRSRKDIFIESDGAVVFPGEPYGLHTRVFINSQGLPTYETKELGLNKKKFELYPLNLSIIVTGNEIVDYFKVLLKAMALAMPEIAEKTRHAPHGMLRLSTGKMSSRTGDVVTASALIDQVKAYMADRANEKIGLNAEERVAATEAIAIGALKYSILRQSPGQDIVFDFEKSLSIEGDSGPYVQYAYARLKSILRKADGLINTFDATHLNSEVELELMRKIFEFPDVMIYAQRKFLPSAVVGYVYKLAVAANKFYEMTPIIKDENGARRSARLMLVVVAAQTIKSGLNVLGIEALEKI